MVQHVDVILDHIDEHQPILQLDDEDYAKLQTLDDPNVYHFEDSLPVWRVKINGKYRSFEVFIFGLEKFYCFDFVTNNAWNYQRNNLIMTNSKRHSKKIWDYETKTWKHGMINID